MTTTGRIRKGPNRVLEIPCSTGLTETEGCPLVTMMVKPLTTVDMIRVMTNGTTLRTCTPIPFNRPTTAPIAGETMIMAISDRPLPPSFTIGPKRAVMDMTAPTDISRPLSPEMTTAACPMAAIARMEVVIRILEMLFEVRKPLETERPRIRRATIATRAGMYGLFIFFAFAITVYLPFC